ncbi:MAG: Acetyltransferase YpeA [Candidatus Celerinatantimonas neptuna]|nr:MAG: Acetyltransferase YpeA [Candidatus Celerinatantimonas neptuna]
MFEIREMKMTDYEAVMALWGQSEGLSLKNADSKENIESYLDRNQGFSFVVMHASDVIGAVLVGTDGRRGYLQHLAVSKDWRGHGLGRQLVDKATGALAKAGVEKTHLFVHDDNLNAQHFYEHSGWFARDEVRMFSYNASDNLNV